MNIQDPKLKYEPNLGVQFIFRKRLKIAGEKDNLAFMKLKKQVVKCKVVSDNSVRLSCHSYKVNPCWDEENSLIDMIIFTPE